VIDSRSYIIMTTEDARRIAELMDYLSDMAKQAEDRIDNADERMNLLAERLSARRWVKDLRDAIARQQYAPTRPRAAARPADDFPTDDFPV
jgi:hypothetical protein